MRDKALGRTWARYAQAAREHAGLTRAELARAAKLGRATVYRWEAGEQRPERAEMVVRFAEATGVDLDEALGAAGLRPAGDAPAEPQRQQVPLDADMVIINARLRDPKVSEQEKHLIRAQLRYLVELAERPADQPAE